MSIIEIIKKPEIYCKQSYRLPVSFINEIYFRRISFHVIAINFFPTKTIQVGKILIAITAGGVSVILLTYLVAYIGDYTEFINSINFVNNIIDKILCKCIPALTPLKSNTTTVLTIKDTQVYVTGNHQTSMRVGKQKFCNLQLS